MGINFPWGQTGRRRARAPLSHGDCGAARPKRGGGERSTYCKYLPLTCHKVFSTSGNFVNVNRARGILRIIHKVIGAPREQHVASLSSSFHS